MIKQLFNINPRKDTIHTSGLSLSLQITVTDVRYLKRLEAKSLAIMTKFHVTCGGRT